MCNSLLVWQRFIYYVCNLGEIRSKFVDYSCEIRPGQTFPNFREFNRIENVTHMQNMNLVHMLFICCAHKFFVQRLAKKNSAFTIFRRSPRTPPLSPVLLQIICRIFPSSMRTTIRLNSAVNMTVCDAGLSAKCPW